MNPVTNAHTNIIRELAELADQVKVMPVVFYNDRIEINSRSFPFGLDVRKKMLRAAVDDSRMVVSDDYAFLAPFRKYMPPLLSRKSWSLRRSILRGVDDDFFSYTGDATEGLMLRLYRLRPKIGKRRPLSATSVKMRLYEAAKGGSDSWRDNVPAGVAQVIDEEWKTVVRFADAPDDTVRVCGMKFPSKGW